MPFKLKYHPDVKSKDLAAIDERNKAIIKRAIEERLREKPEKYGKPLRHTFKGYWKLRVGDYRIVFKKADNVIRIYAILHRKEVYAIVNKRIS